MRSKKDKLEIYIVPLTPRQLDIYKGLKQIGEEIAAFYYDGVKIYNSKDFIIKPYLLAHILREIEGGIRDIWSLKNPSEKKCPKCNKVLEKKSHIQSICEALNVAEDDEFALKWKNLATKFHIFAHRHGVWKSPRENDEFNDLWLEFESILYHIIGNFLNILARLDRILILDKPTQNMINTLPNLLKIDSLYFYFFKNTESEKWLIPLKNAGFFDPKNNPNPYKDPGNPDQIRYTHWAVLYYLERIAKYNSKDPKNQILNALEEIVDKIIANRNENIYTDWNILKIISLFPNNKIKKEYTHFIGKLLKSKGDPILISGEIEKSFLPKLISVGNKELLIEFLNEIIDYKEVKVGDRKEYRPILESYYYDRAIARNSKQIAKICGIDALIIGGGKIEEFIKIDEKEFSKWRMNTIEDHIQNFSRERYSFQLVSFVRDMLEELPPTEIKNILRDFLNKEDSIYKRLAIHSINYHYSELNDLFWEYKENPLDNKYAKHEIYELLKSNSEKLGAEEVEKLISWIEKANYYLSDEATKDSDLAEKQKTYRKKEWLNAVEKNTNPKIKELLIRYNLIVPEEVDHPGYDIYIHSGWSGVESDRKAEQIKEMTCESIVEFLKSPIERKRYGRINEEGRSDALREAIKINPEKFYACLKLFHNIDLIYQNEILRAYEEIWNIGKEIDWDKTFWFIKSLISNDNFWKKKAEWDSIDYRISSIFHIIRLIETGSREDSRAFDSKYISSAEEILIILSKHIPTNEEPSDMGDMASTVVNSKLGQLFEAMVVLSLRYARVFKKEEKDKNERWLVSLKKYFNDLLQKKENRPKEFSFIIGQFLPQLMFLDESWIKKNLELIFLKQFEEQWEWFFSGYLYYSNTVYDDIYNLLKDQGNYSRAIKTKFADNFITEKLTQHIAIGYGQEWETLDDEDSLINQLLNEGRPDQFSALIRFFFNAKNEDKDNIKKKVKPIWGRIVNIIKERIDQKEFQKISASLSKWVDIVDEIDDEVFELLMLSAPYITHSQYSDDFIDFLHEFVNRSPEPTADFLLKMIEDGVSPWWESTKINYIVEELYKNKLKNKADKICNIFAENGRFFLKKVYDDNNNDKK